ncbi:DUF6597 domain-containing transcriptional factor [Propionibacteriaceae bacterium Y1923]
MLAPEALAAQSPHRVATPDERLSRWVEHYWSVTWDLPPGESAARSTLSSPTAHLTVERGGVARAGTDGQGIWVTGPVTDGVFDVRLTGRGSTVGVKFRPGGLVAFTPVDMAGLTNRTLAATDLFEGVDQLERIAWDATSAAAELDGWLLSRGPVDLEDHDRFRRVWQVLEGEPITTVGALAERVGSSPRSLQRLFRRFVGTGVKRTLLRRRVCEAVEAIDRGRRGDWADLAIELGWFDQAHFIRDFRSVTGFTPAGYAHRDRSAH